MVSVIGILAILLGVTIGLIMYKIANQAYEKGFWKTLKDLAIIALIVIVLGTFVMPGLIAGLLRGYSSAVGQQIGLIVGIAYFILTIILFGSLLSRVPGIEPWQKQVIWVFTIFFGFLAGKIILWPEVQKWWYWKVLPSDEVWAVSFRMGWDIPIAIGGILLFFFIVNLGTKLLTGGGKK